MKSGINPFDSQEAKPYKNNPEILAMTNLVKYLNFPSFNSLRDHIKPSFIILLFNDEMTTSNICIMKARDASNYIPSAHIRTMTSTNLRRY